jgi:prephenate dehydrogenase
VQVATDLVGRLGAQPLFLDAEEHDGLTAGVDHLPAVLAATLLETTALTAPWREMRKLAGGQYQVATHFVSGDPAAYRDAILANRENVVRWIDTFIANLQQWRQKVAEDQGDVLAESFRRAFEARDRWQREKAEGRWDEREQVNLEDVTGGWRGLLGIRRQPRKPEQ